MNLEHPIMKKIFLVILILPAFLLINCGKKQDNAASLAVVDSTLPESADSVYLSDVKYYLTSDSIGPIYVGNPVNNLPPSVPGLYDNVVMNETPIAMAYTFILGIEPQFTVYSFTESLVDVIVLEGNSRGVNTPDGVVSICDPFSKVLALKGSRSVWQSFEGEGIWYWEWNGLWFGVDESNISEQLELALYDEKHPPRAAEFTEDVKIGYIGTGLPY